MTNEYTKLYTPREVCERFNIVPRTLLNWSYKGQIKFIRTEAGHRRYILPEQGQNPSTKWRICYCRVSTRKQKEDLERQVEFFRLKYPNHIIIKDFGSGLNFKRKGLKTILEYAMQGLIEELVVTHRDRLCRFGFEIFETIISTMSNGKIVVLDRREMSPQTEIVEDIVSIITIFTSKIYGARSHSVKHKIQDLKESIQESIQNSEV